MNIKIQESPLQVENSGTSLSAMLDDSYDKAIEALGLPWLPWIGKNFRRAHKKTVILGESVYVYGAHKDRDRNRTEMNEKDHLRQGVVRRHKGRYLRNLERAVFLKRRPTSAERLSFWSQVVYHNLVLQLLPSRKTKDRPNLDHYAEGWKAFLSLLGVLQAQRCIVYGVEAIKIKALQKVLGLPDKILMKKKFPAIGKCQPLRMSLLLEGREVDFLFIRHPSAFFSWEKWGQVMRDTGMTFESSQVALG